MYRILLALMFFSTTAFADFSEIYQNSVHIPYDIIRMGDGYLAHGLGKFIAKIDTNSNINVLMQSSNSREINIISVYDNSSYILTTNSQNLDAVVLKTNDYLQYDTIFTGKDIGANAIIANQNGLFLPIIHSGASNKYSIAKIENGNLTTVKNFQNAIFELVKLSENEIVALGTMPNNSLIYSSDSGDNFQEIPLNDQNLERIKVYDSNIFISSLDGRLIKSIDKGTTWNTIFDDASFNGSATFYICNNDTIYFAPSANNNSSVLYKTEDGGENWEEVYQIDGEAITSILVDGNKAILGTTGGKILYNDKFTSVQEWQVLEPNSLKVYPNPSSEYLTIDIKEEIKSFKIVDMQGNDVSGKVNLVGKTLDLTNLASGTYTLMIDGKTAQVAINR